VSIQALGRVLDYSRSEGNARLALIIIVTVESDDGLCWAAIDTIAKWGNMNPRTTQRAVRELEGLGELQVWREAGPLRTNVYRCLIGEGGVKLSPLGNVPPIYWAVMKRPAQLDGGGVTSPPELSPNSVVVKDSSSIPEETTTDSGANLTPGGDILTRVCALGVDIFNAQRLVLETPGETLEQYLEWAAIGQRCNQLTSPAGWFIAAVRDRWVAPRWITQRVVPKEGRRYVEGELKDFIEH
jgi:hypothetical protein